MLKQIKILVLICVVLVSQVASAVPETGEKPEMVEKGTMTEIIRQGGEVFFKLKRTGEIVSCSEDDLLWNIGSSGHFLAAAMSGSYKNDGRTPERAIEVNADPKLFARYILPFLENGKVAIGKWEDAEYVKEFLNRWLIPIEQEDVKPVDSGRSILRVAVEIESDGETAKQNSSCPEGYLLVPGNPDYSTPTAGKDFCVMKYDASRGADGKAVSAIAPPWVNINRMEAEAACRANGEGYDLISNEQYMVVSRNIEATPSNWSGGQVGSGHLSRGNSDSQSALAPRADDSQGYFGLPDYQRNDGIHKRTFALNTGENTEAIVWDWAGNVWKWVKGDLRTGQHRWQEYTDETHFSANNPNRNLFAPSGQYNSNQNMGKIFMWDVGAALRGGNWGSGAVAGVFAADLYESASNRHANVGFRCAFTPHAGN